MPDLITKNIKYLYKYRSLYGIQKEYAKKTITDNEIYFPAPIEFNDPFDCRPNFSFIGSHLEKKEFFKKVCTSMAPKLEKIQQNILVNNFLKNWEKNYPSLVKKLNQATEDLLNTTGVCCMSEDPENILMWSHYSNGHKGICLIFKLESRIPFFREIHPVYYQSNYPNINFVTDDENTMLKFSILTKSNHWSYEKEWRIIKPKEGRKIITFPEEILVGVILGCKILEEDKKQVIEWSRSRKYPPKIYTAEQKKDSFGVEIREI